MFVAELSKGIQVAISDIFEWIRNSNGEVSNLALELFSEIVACCRYHYYHLIDMLNCITAHLSDTMQIVTGFLLESMQTRTLKLSSETLIVYLSKFLDSTLKNRGVQAH
jgi:hypothetical protein